MANKRYENSRSKKKYVKRGSKNINYQVTSFNTIQYHTIPKSDNDIYIITQAGDRLDLLANQFYKDPTLWWYIARANHLKFMTLEPGLSLRIPATTNYASGI